MRLYNHILNEDRKTEFYETASMIGVIASNSLIKEIDKFLNSAESNSDIKHILSVIKKEIKNGYDWSQEGVSVIKGLTPTENKDDMNWLMDLCALIKGMHTFMKEIGKSVVGSNPNFIHSRINDYYEVEKEALGVMQGSKANTADCIIFKGGSVSDLLNAMKKESISPDKALQYINVGKKFKLLQVSLKKSEKGAQLGKITSFLKKSLGYGGDVESAVKVLADDINNDYDILLNEGIWDKIKSFATDIWDKLKNAVNKLAQSFISKYTSIFKKSPDQTHIKQFFYEAGISESLINDSIINDMINEKINSNTQQIIDSISKTPERVINIVNNQIKKLKAQSSSNESIYTDISYNKVVKKFKSNKSTAVFTLISNYLTVRTLIDMVSDQRNIAEVTNRLVAEMMFGGTKLPLWKVYGDYGDGHAYIYMGTIDTFLKERGSKIPNIEILGIRISPTNEYYTIMVMMLEGIYDEGKKYVMLRTGTNSSSRITFVFEGTLVKGPYPLGAPLKNILKKKE